VRVAESGAYALHRLWTGAARGDPGTAAVTAMAATDLFGNRTNVDDAAKSRVKGSV
jgi:hypothetical protein